MKKILIAVFFLSATLLIMGNGKDLVRQAETPRGTSPEAVAAFREISGNIKKGETLYDISKKYHLDFGTLFKLREASADIHELRNLRPDRPYAIALDGNDRVCSFVYWIDDDNMLTIKGTASGYCASNEPVFYEKKVIRLGGGIKDNLVSSVESAQGDLGLALEISDIFAWDIDFTTDLRNGDVYKVVVEGLYLDGQFRKYGEILSAEFSNNGRTYRACSFARTGRTDYFDENGRSLKKAFLKVPLNFRRVSSFFSGRCMHPILKIARPRHGVDYAAPYGTPVSAAGDGTVIVSGRKGQYGRLVGIRHPNGYTTYYGHFSRIVKGMSAGRKVEQGDLIGYVGATGLATGPLLHCEMRVRGKAVNPLTAPLPHGEPIPVSLMNDFIAFRRTMDTQLASMSIPSEAFASAVNIADNKL
ncbi:MAG: peptidoglycan DD-metalloendopeptidase family protein [Acidobacteriota bacterium]